MAMGTRKRRQRQEQLWVTHTELVTGPGHPFYKRLSQLLDGEKFDEFCEQECAKFYADSNGRPSLTPGTYFRLLLVGYFEGTDGPRVALVHQYLRPDGTVGASGRPDPKAVLERGTLYVASRLLDLTSA